MSINIQNDEYIRSRCSAILACPNPGSHRTESLHDNGIIHYPLLDLDPDLSATEFNLLDACLTGINQFLHSSHVCTSHSLEIVAFIDHSCHV
jgi:hypothetical protein